ncbi:MAG TPA: hypothetical protein VGI39_03370 [Polyangiaceae bacterium]|jgi:hypothetical protein
MKLGNWLAVFGCVGLGVAGALSAEGCTATLTIGSCDGGCVVPADDSGIVTEVDASAVVGDSGSTPPSPCNTCLYSQCVGAYARCVADPTCLAAYQCAVIPTCAADDACVTSCVASASALGQALYDDLSICDFFSECPGGATAPGCAATCAPSTDYCALPIVDSGTPEDSGSATDSAAPPPDAGEDAGTPTDAGSGVDSAPPAQTCDQCQAAQCASQLQACAPNTACGNYNQCLLGCTTSACDTACISQNPTGVAQAAALGTCISTNCAQCN